MKMMTMKIPSLFSTPQVLKKEKEVEIKKICQKEMEKKNSFANNMNQNKPYQRPFKRDLCKYYLNGVCTKGDKCTYSHVIKDFPCKYYITLGNCDNRECR